jgi:hypothetical protein
MISQNEIPKIILSQINELDFWARARWGVREMYAAPDALHLVVPRKKIVVTLDRGLDAYRIEIISKRTGKVTKTFDEVYCDQLVEIIEAGLLYGKQG